MNDSDGGNDPDSRETKTRIQLLPPDIGNKQYQTIERTNYSPDSNGDVCNQANNEYHNDVGINIIVVIKTLQPT